VTVKLSASLSLPAGLYASGLAAYAYAHVIDGDFVDRSVYWYYLGVGYER
jgi:hypothetical protein